MTSAINQYSELKNRYIRMCELGEGAFGRVYLAEKQAYLLQTSHLTAN